MLIESQSNPNIKKVRALLDKHRARDREDAFVIEGIRMFNETPREILREVYVSESFFKKNPLNNIEKLYIVKDELFRKLSDVKTPQGVLAVAARMHYRTEDILKGGLVIILEGLQDPGNLGTIIRTGEAAGIAGVIMDENTADIYSTKVVRSTMGSIFRVPFIRTGSVVGLVPEIKDRGYTIYSASLEGSRSVEEIRFKKASAIVIGNEGSGISPELVALSDHTVRIPMEGRVESLNAAVSAAILMYGYRFGGYE